jgi:hypothetical protein
MADRLCLARSQDGVNWHKPSLGVTPFPSNIMVGVDVLNAASSCCQRWQIGCGSRHCNLFTVVI